MPDDRLEQLQHFRALRGAQRLDILTIGSPFNDLFDRFVVIAREHGDGTLIMCPQCDPLAPLGHGEMRPVSGETLNTFQRELNEAAAAWQADYVPEGIHDGQTLIVERVEATLYRRVRMIAPPRSSAHGRMLAAWTRAFPIIRGFMA